MSAEEKVGKTVIAERGKRYAQSNLSVSGLVVSRKLTRLHPVVVGFLYVTLFVLG